MGATANRLPQLERAVSRYQRALARGVAPCRADGDVQAQIDSFRAALERAELRAAQMKKFLQIAQVPMGQTLLWRNFILHLDRLVRTCGGVTLRLRAEEAVGRWAALGLDAELLRRLVAEVFGLDALTEKGRKIECPNGAE